MDEERGGGAEPGMELARQAKEAFDKQSYESCLSTLNKLMEIRRHDKRVAHNRSVARYLLSNLTLTDEFRRNLHTLKAQFDREAEGSGLQHSVSEKGVLLFNQALIHRRLHQNSKAIDILEQLVRVADSLTDSLSTESSLLLIELYIVTHQLDKAVTHIDHIEIQLYGQSLNGRGENEETPVAKDQYRPRIHFFKAQIHLLNRNVKACKKELKSYTSMAGNSACAQYLKAHVEYLRQNYRKALKVLGSAPKNPIGPDTGECLSSYFFNDLGCVHYTLGKYSLAAHYFRKALEENDAALNGFPPLDKATPLSGRPLGVLGVNCRHILLYNLGLQQLYAGHPAAAFDSLLEVVQVYHTNPQLWLRLAEACIAAQAKGVEEERLHKRSFKNVLVSEVFGKNLHRKLVVAPRTNTVHGSNQDTTTHSAEAHTQSAAMPAPTHEFAAICLSNAKFLLPSNPPMMDEDPSNLTSPVPAPPGPPIQGHSTSLLRCYVLSCQSYVSLALGDPVSSLAFSRELLATPLLSGGLRFLGQVYLAEALVLLGRVTEALTHLSPESVVNISVSSPKPVPKDTDSDQVFQVNNNPPNSGPQVHQFPDSLSHARAVMLFNTAVIYCISHENDKARRTLQESVKLFSSPPPPQTVLLSAFIELKSGNTAAALHLLKVAHPYPHGTDIQKKSRKTTAATYLAMKH